MQDQIQAVEAQTKVQTWKKDIVYHVKAQSAPLQEQFREIIGEVKSISKVVIEFLQVISQPKLTLMQSL